MKDVVISFINITKTGLFCSESGYLPPKTAIRILPEEETDNLVGKRFFTGDGNLSAKRNRHVSPSGKGKVLFLRYRFTPGWMVIERPSCRASVRNDSRPVFAGFPGRKTAISEIRHRGVQIEPFNITLAVVSENRAHRASYISLPSRASGPIIISSCAPVGSEK